MVSFMDVSPYVSYHRDRMEAARRRRVAARDAALRALDAMRPILEATPGLERAYVFGSLSRGRFREDSDIDLAVEGIGAEDLRQLRSRLETVAPCEVDLVDLGDCGKPFADFIRKHGRMIHERPR